uniref:Uncharacterized protein n=1 Tax=Timema tahoe TaxID=61484 RepID=A0A7R9NWC0_9NEOP|nr:unnamed protein product [Timema tahoe]
MVPWRHYAAYVSTTRTNSTHGDVSCIDSSLAHLKVLCDDSILVRRWFCRTTNFRLVMLQGYHCLVALALLSAAAAAPALPEVICEGVVLERGQTQLREDK